MKGMMKRANIDLSQAPSMRNDGPQSYTFESSPNRDWVEPLKHVAKSTGQAMEDLNKAYVELLKNTIEELNLKIDSITERQRDHNELIDETMDSLIRVISAATTGESIDEESVASLQKFVARNLPSTGEQE